MKISTQNFFCVFDLDQVDPIENIIGFRFLKICVSLRISVLLKSINTIYNEYMNMKGCGIYKITNKINNKVYIGQSVHVERRINEHKNLLRNNKHHNQHLQHSYNKYGKKNFIFNIICECEANELNEKEIFYIKKYNSFLDGYNLTPGGSYNYTNDIEKKIKKYDEKNNIQNLLLNGEKINDIANIIPCNKIDVKIYCRNHNIIKPISAYINRKTTNTGVRYLTLLSSGIWQYRRTYQNPNNITRVKYEDIKNTVISRHYLWIIDDEKKLKEAIKQSYMLQKINNNYKKGKKIAKIRENNRKKQVFAQKRALKAFRELFCTKDNKQKTSPVGVTYLRFSTGDNSWNFKKNDKKGYIKRQNIVDLYKEIKKQGYSWDIEDKFLLQKAIQEVKLFREERKRPFSQRQAKFEII